MLLEFHLFGTNLGKSPDLVIRSERISAVRVIQDNEVYLDTVGPSYCVSEDFLTVLSKVKSWENS